MKREAEDDDCFITQVQPKKRARRSQPETLPVGQYAAEPSGSHSESKKSRRSRRGSESAAYEDAPNVKSPRKSKPKDEEKRLKRWRKKAPRAWLETRSRALTQRMFALDRQRLNDIPEHPTETITLAGTTGNVYTIVVDKVPSCNCPHAMKGNQCKHIAYVLSRVLRVKRSELEYQLAFTSKELREIFDQAPALPSQTADDSEKDGNRKKIEGECPICVVDFEPDSGEKIVYCKASCGNNIHDTCFKLWAKTKPAGGVTCPFCRSTWEQDAGNLRGIAAADGTKNVEGYVNVASQLGLSGRRDYSTYNSFWMRQQLSNGEIAWDEEGAMNHDWQG